MSSSPVPDISLVIPIFNEEANIERMVLACEAVMKELGHSYEMIFINDGSSDTSSDILRRLAHDRPYLKGLVFSRNFGHQAALHAGLMKSRGTYVITMDGDLQHPPSLIPELLAKAEEGFLVVNTRRLEQSDLPLTKRLSSKWYYALLNILSDVHIEPASADFRLMHRKAVDVFLSLPERQRFNRGLVAWLGFKQTFVDFTPGVREAGETKFSFMRMLRFGLDGVTSFSVKPLRLAFYIGSIVSAASILYGLYAIVIFALGRAVAGWTSLLVSVLFLGGLILISLGVIGEYVARIYNEVRARPIYILEEEIEFPENS